MTPTAWKTSDRDGPNRARWRWLLIVIAALLLTACQGPDPRAVDIRTPPTIAPQKLDPTAPPPSRRPGAHGELTDRLTDRTQQPRRAASEPSRQPVIPVQHTASPGLQNAGSPQPAPQPHAPPPTAASQQSAPSSTSTTDTTPAVPQQSSRSTKPRTYPRAPAGVPCRRPAHRHRAQQWCPPGIPRGSWRPPGLSQPWPKDEYLCDGGDKIPSAQVRKDWSVEGLALEDTVVHYDTLDGETRVEPTNRVCIYAPRFASVRKVQNVQQHNQLDGLARVDQPLGIDGVSKKQSVRTGVQPVQPFLNNGAASAGEFHERTPPIGLENQEGLVGMHGNLLPYEDRNDLGDEQVKNTDKARLATRMQAAATWSGDMAVQVVIDNIATHMDVHATTTGAVHEYSLQGKPRLRVCKLASSDKAHPGDTVEFTLKFENVGEQPIGNVTVMDNLSTRLEYVEESQTCSLTADFHTSENQGESETLRWEIQNPLEVGEGGVIRFTCRIR